MLFLLFSTVDHQSDRRLKNGENTKPRGGKGRAERLIACVAGGFVRAESKVLAAETRWL